MRINLQRQLFFLMALLASCDQLASRYDHYDLEGKMIVPPEISLALPGDDGGANNKILTGNFTGAPIKTIRWQQLDGPAIMTFHPEDQLTTRPSAPAGGEYTVQLIVVDIFGKEHRTNTTLSWQEESPTPSGTPTPTPTSESPTPSPTVTPTPEDPGLPPVVEVGADILAKSVFNKTATVTPSGATLAWSMASGPGTVTFSAAHEATTSIQATLDGEYRIVLTATDISGLSSSDFFTLRWDATPPPALTSLTAVQGSTLGVITVELQFPAAVTDYHAVAVKRIIGAAAGNDCSAGTTIKSYSAFTSAATETIQDDTGEPGAFFSYLACITDQAGNTTNSNSVSNVEAKPHILFVSQSTYTGNLGGLNGADTTCSTLATASGIAFLQAEPLFKAVLSDETTAARERIHVRGKVISTWMDLGEETLAASRSDFWSGALLHEVSRENANNGFSGPTWSGSTAAGAIQAAGNCLNWSTANAASNGFFGTANTPATWLESASGTCDVARSIYCISQYSVPPLAGFSAQTSPEAGGKIALALTLPADTSKYDQVVVRRAAGATAPPSSCDAGTIVWTLANLSTLSPSTVDATGSAGTLFSYRACVLDRFGNTLHSTVQQGVTSSL
jgi:hypothetical protein